MDISGFKGQYRWLSNFWPAKVAYNRITFPTVEHAYQAAKTHDRETQLMIASLARPGEAKRMGRSIEVRSSWNKDKLSVMEELLRSKFAIPHLRIALKRTEPSQLIETNWWGDTFWGVCNEQGHNHLGKLLMKIRSEIK